MEYVLQTHVNKNFNLVFLLFTPMEVGTMSRLFESSLYGTAFVRITVQNWKNFKTLLYSLLLKFRFKCFLTDDRFTNYYCVRMYWFQLYNYCDKVHYMYLSKFVNEPLKSYRTGAGPFSLWTTRFGMVSRLVLKIVT